MAESLFDIFGDRKTEDVRSVARQRHPLYNNENIGKIAYKGPGLVKINDPVKRGLGPVKPNEPLKPGKKAGEPKKSFLCNTGQALQLQSTPVQRPLTPKCRNTSRKVFNTQVIYNDADTEKDDCCFEELQFTKPTYKYDNFHTDLLDYYALLQPEALQRQCPDSPPTPPPQTQKREMEFDNSYEDEFFKDDFSSENVYEEDLNLPEIY